MPWFGIVQKKANILKVSLAMTFMTSEYIKCGFTFRALMRKHELTCNLIIICVFNKDEKTQNLEQTSLNTIYIQLTL